MRFYEAILFDFDGVLIDSEPIHFECWREVLLPFGITLDWDLYRRRFIGVSDLAMIEDLAKLRRPPADVDAIWREYPHKRALFRARTANGIAITAPVRNVLGELDGVRLAIVSSSGRDEIEPILTGAGIRDRFSALITREDVADLKPAPEPYLTAAQRLGVSHALVVEDSPAGIASGRAAGFDVLEVDCAARMPELLRAHLQRFKSG